MLKVNNIGSDNSIFNQFMMEIRDQNVQKDSMRFRRNLSRLGEIMAYEISKKLTYRNKQITTPLGDIEMQLLDTEPVLATVLRAGLPFHQGFLSYFDHADNAFVSAYRMHVPPNDFEVKVEYLASPDLTNRTVIICDPMLATGQSMYLSYQALIENYGKPKSVHFAAVVGSNEGVEFLQRKLKKTPSTLWIGAIDTEMTAQSYIVPGLGDAGDLAFGMKDS